MIIFRIYLFLFLVACSLSHHAQYNGLVFSYPLDRSVVVTGNYGEIRPNHFHAGLDFSTDPTANLPIKSIADGYVSRIKISSVGYGRVIYVTHQNGYVSVYAHQKKYALKIDDYVKKQQLEQRKNELELFPKVNELSVKKGEVIGFTGNSGSSTGPHLHFEIRDEKTEVPINPLLVYDVKDDIKPSLTHLVIYDTKDTNNILQQLLLPVKNKGSKLSIDKPIVRLSTSKFAIGFSGFDVANATTNKNNIYEAKVKLDNQLIYHHQLNTISFDNGRYVNVFSDKVGGIKYQKCFAPTCFDIAIYKTLINGGKIELNDTLLHTIELIVADEKGNSNSLSFKVKTSNVSGYKSTNKINAFCDKDFIQKENDYDIFIPKGALTNGLIISKKVYVKKPLNGDVTIGNKNDKLIRAVKIGLKVNPIKGKETKLVMTVNNDVIGGKFDGAWLRAESKTFGVFNYKYDTIAPTITIQKSKKNSADVNKLRAKIVDNMSGIADYNIYVNDVWQIAEYDAKTATVLCVFDANAPKGNVVIRIEVTDRVGNIAKQEIKVLR